MNWVDAAFIAVIVISAICAYFRGMVREVLSLAAWAGAALAAFMAREPLRPHVAQWVEPPILADIVGTGAVFLVVLVILKIITNMIADVVQDSMLGGIDRILGLVVGAVRGAFVLVLAYILAGMFVPETDKWPDAVKQARGLPIIADAARRVLDKVPDAYRPRMVEPPVPGGPSFNDLLRPPARSR